MSKKSSGRKTERVPVPTNRELKDASKQLRKGHSSAGRVMAEKSKLSRKKK